MLRPSCSTRGVASVTATLIPQTGSIASAAAAPVTCRLRDATISASIDSAISSALAAPMSSPAGVRSFARRSAATPRVLSSSTTAAPRFRLATSPT